MLIKYHLFFSEKTLETKDDFKKLAKRIEKDTGYKTSMKVYKRGSLRGYVELRLRKKGDTYPEWDFDYGRKLIKEYDRPEPNPTFVDTHSFSYYIGNKIFDL